MGFWSGLIAFISTVAYVVVQLLQIVGAVHYPLDEILIYGTSLCIVIPFVLEMLSLHYFVPIERKLWSHAAVVFATIYAVFVTANYVVQLATVIPATLQGRGEEIQLLVQTPHSMFWDFDAIGYIFMGFATLIAAPAMAGRGFQRWVRLSFLANAAVTPLIAFVYFGGEFSERLLFIGFPWAITAPLAMLLPALMFKREWNGVGKPA